MFRIAILTDGGDELYSEALTLKTGKERVASGKPGNGMDLYHATGKVPAGVLSGDDQRWQFSVNITKINPERKLTVTPKDKPAASNVKAPEVRQTAEQIKSAAK